MIRFKDFLEKLKTIDWDLIVFWVTRISKLSQIVFMPGTILNIHNLDIIAIQKLHVSKNCSPVSANVHTSFPATSHTCCAYSSDNLSSPC